MSRSSLLNISECASLKLCFFLGEETLKFLPDSPKLIVVSFWTSVLVPKIFNIFHLKSRGVQLVEILQV